MSEAPQIPADTANKLGKLIPRLATDHDGERMATVAAIGRTLESAGLDLNDFAAAVNEIPNAAQRDDASDRQRERSEAWHDGFSAGLAAGMKANRSASNQGASTSSYRAGGDRTERRHRDRQTRGPRWRDLARTQALAWMDLLLQDAGTPADARRFIEGVRQRLWHSPHKGVTASEAATLTKHIRAAWQRGVTP